MTPEFIAQVESITGYREKRDQSTQFFLQNPQHFEELIAFCFSVKHKNSYKACWILEMICYEKLEWITPHLDFFCTNIKKLTNDSAIRPASKICLLIATAHFKKKELLLTENQLKRITENCFDWLIQDTKVASKCYSIRTLYWLGNHFDWIHPELKIILEKDYSNHSPAYKAVTREILNKINQRNN